MRRRIVLLGAVLAILLTAAQVSGQALTSEVGWLFRTITISQKNSYGTVTSSAVSTVKIPTFDLGFAVQGQGLLMESGITITFMNSLNIPYEAMTDYMILMDRYYLGLGFVLEPKAAPFNFFALVRAYPLAMLYYPILDDPYLIGMMSLRGGMELLFSTKLAVKVMVELPFAFNGGDANDYYYSNYSSVDIKGYNLKFCIVVPGLNF